MREKDLIIYGSLHVSAQSDVYHGYGVEGCVCAYAEVRSRDIIGDGSRNNDEGNAQFLVLLSSFHHL